MDENLEQLVENSIEENAKPLGTSSKYGKFKDADSLFTAYNNLESEYTKKCQAYSALKKEYEENEANSPKVLSNQEETLSSAERERLLQEYILNNKELKDKLIARYFDELILPASPKLISSDRGGGSVISPISKPHTLEEAESIVKDMFDKRKN